METDLKVGLIGTGFAARLRAETLHADSRSRLMAVVGYNPQKTAEFAQKYGARMLESWQELVDLDELDLVIISTINRDHGAIAKAALTAQKHVVVEYPLALNFEEAQSLWILSKTQHKLLHIEHIEILGGLHQAFKQTLPQLGEISYLRYSKIAPKHPAPQRWNYQKEGFGFPLVASLSCIHRFTDALGTVETVYAQNRYWPEHSDYYHGCFCTAQLHFTCGTIADIIYGKGDVFWHPERKLEAHGHQGTLIFEGDRGALIQLDKTTEIPVGTRRGLFAQDTRQVLDYLTEGTELYVNPQSSLYALKVACAAERSAATGQKVTVNVS
ncbi:Gfo/Idh/MocA family oxidoreductase [Roseofilum reptotaenium CS-1145]|uniref:Glycosyl transferase family 2 n=1 Tax=Roseofilum reptotaenium AO1-A TaxID=1925591 RepID=A0A1L9QP37_9CYAN|nr:Gfo/Idh/MocA family oxidoreductase [Roseofilum reptotaenium]MDB9516427.1 Gfo/Idh/MocA family oxidoreductase [Roseofilum reptotaenium CS-1145]OJJ24424.1 glycosyl transferase family 2 [Roseofilum reptotaenium AO1-A]